MEKVLLCSDSSPSFLRLFDLSIAPPLLFYSYIPVIIISILLGLYVLKKDNYSLPSKLLFLVELFFSLWVFDIFIMWIAAYNSFVMFAWQMNSVFEVPIFILSVYFVYVFVSENRQDISNRVKLLLIALASPFAILLSTKLNIVAYDLTVCEGINGYLWDYMYVMELICIFWVLNIGLKKIREVQIAPAKKKEVTYLTLGVISFLVLFMVSNFIGEVTGVQEISFIGSFGMVLFLGLLTYMIVKFKAFNIKLLGTQALVWSLNILIASQFFFIVTNVNRVLTGVTLLMAFIFGYFLILSVKREIELSEQKSEFMSFASHEIRSPMTAVKGYSSMILEGSMGEINPQVKDSVQKIMISANGVVNLIAQYLDKSKLELGKLEYTFKTFDMSKLLKETVQGFQVNAEQKKLAIVCQLDDKPISADIDEGKIKEVIGNIIDNSIKYTEQGSVTVSLSEKDGRVLVKVSDTGAGIPQEMIQHLFKKFSRVDAKKVNIRGTGLGLYLAKIFITGHKGKIWAESEGDGKGSQFYVELPVKQASLG